MLAELPLHIGLGQEAGSGGKILDGRFYLARSHQQCDRRPTVANNGQKSQAVHRAGHLDIGKYDRDVGGGLQELDCMIRIHGLDDLKTQLAHHLSRAQTNEKLVLDYQNKEFVSHRIGYFTLEVDR